MADHQVEHHGYSCPVLSRIDLCRSIIDVYENVLYKSIHYIDNVEQIDDGQRMNK